MPIRNRTLSSSPIPPRRAGSGSRAVDELRLSQVWAGDAVLLRAARSVVTTDAPFNLRWLGGLVLQERQSLRDIGLASFTISVLTIFPPLLVMATVNRVLQFHSVSTLVLLSVVMAVVFAYETLLGYARRLIISVIGARLDTKLGLHLFNRLLRLPLDYFRAQSGRRNHVSDRAGLSDPRVSDRQAADARSSTSSRLSWCFRSCSI